MENKLQKQMTSRHIMMLALGGAIGAGLFKGSGEAIGIAGPSIILAFLLGGLVLFIVMNGLGRLVLTATMFKVCQESSNLSLAKERLILLIGCTGPYGWSILSLKQLRQQALCSCGFHTFPLGYLC